MSTNPKRARKKQARDAMVAARQAALRRRRAARLAAVVGVLGAIIGVALASGGDDSKPTDEAGQSPQVDESATPQIDEAACGAEPPAPADPQTYDAPGEVLENGVDYAAVVHTSCGDIEMDLLEDETPIAVNNFVFLAREGFYDSLIWHRVEQNSVIQTGDPDGVNGQEPDGPGYQIEEEPPKSGQAYTYGAVGFANAGPGSTGSQWFIVVQEEGSAGFPPNYTVFARVEGSKEALDQISMQETFGSNAPDASEAVKPIIPIYIESIEIVEL